MKCFLVPAFLVALSMPSFAQSVCDMTIADLPEIHGIRLGVSRREVEKAYTFEQASLQSGNAATNQDIQHLEGIWLGFYKESLAAVEFDYDRSAEWKNVGEFAMFLQHKLRLPIKSWVFVDRTEALMECRGFTAAISTVRNTLSLTDTFAKTAARNAVGSRTRIYQP